MNTSYVLSLLTASGLVLPLGAQVVNDGATGTLSNVTNNITGDVTVGTNGSFTLLILSNNTLLTNSLNGLIGRNATAKSNEVQLLSASARWRMGGSLFVGSNGAASRLVVSNGALVENNNGTLGSRLEGSNNRAMGGVETSGESTHRIPRSAHSSTVRVTGSLSVQVSASSVQSLSMEREAHWLSSRLVVTTVSLEVAVGVAPSIAGEQRT